MRKNQEDKFQKLEKRIAAPEVKVQEQYVGKCQFCNETNKLNLPFKAELKFCMSCGKRIQYFKTVDQNL